VTKFVRRDIAVPENPGEQTAADCLSAMDRDYRATAIGMAEKTMATPDADNGETEPTQGLDQNRP